MSPSLVGLQAKGFTDVAKAILEVHRYLPDQETEPRFQNYEITYQDNWVVLDALNHIKDEIDSTLSFRWSCRMGICGSCGMMVNGEPRLTCKDALSQYGDTVEIAPLANFPVVRDLVIEADGFMEKLKSVKPWIIRAKELALEEGPTTQSQGELEEFKQFSMCINCMLCYAACSQYGLNKDFLGPAAIALGQRYNMDSRDGASKERGDIINSHEGIWECTFIGDCSVVCPKNVDPAHAIQLAKAEGAMDMLKSFVMPWSAKS